MKKVVINQCFGGLGLSPWAIEIYCKMKFGEQVYFYGVPYRRIEKIDLGKHKVYKVDPNGRNLFCKPYLKDLGDSFWSNVHERYLFNPNDICRDDDILVTVVENLGREANGLCADLKVVEIPNDVDWSISEYNGREIIEESHRTWG